MYCVATDRECKTQVALLTFLLLHLRSVLFQQNVEIDQIRCVFLLWFNVLTPEGEKRKSHGEQERNNLFLMKISP